MSFKPRAIKLMGSSDVLSTDKRATEQATKQVARQEEVIWMPADDLSGQDDLVAQDNFSDQAVSQQSCVATDDQIDSQVDQAIAQLLSGDFHSQWEQSKQFAKRFAEWGDRAIPCLLKHLKSQADPDIQWFLVRILSGFGHASVVEALADLLVTTSHEPLQTEITKALAGFGETAITHLNRLLMPVADDNLEAEAEAMYNQRLLAVRVLARIRRGKTIEPLLSVATDPDPALREIAIEALGSFHDERITPLLLGALEDEPAICLEAIRTLGRRSDLLASVDLITPLKKCLHSAYEAIACESAVALGRLGHPRAIQVLGEQLSAPLATPVKISMVQALGWLNVGDAIAYLAEAFAYDMPIVMPAVKQAIAKALGQTHETTLKKRAASPLVAWLEDSVNATNVNATNVNATSVNATSVNATNINENLDADVALTQAVLTALTRLAVPAAIDPLIVMLGHPDLRIRMHVLSALRQIAPNEAQSKIQRYLHSESLSPVVKQYISETLAAW